MKANEFVKRFGREKAKEFSQITIKGLSQEYCFEINTSESVGLAYVNLDDLKRLVESHELVEKCGGLNSLKAWAKETKSKLSLATYFHCNKPPILIQIENAEKAIADVEACQ